MYNIDEVSVIDMEPEGNVDVREAGPRGVQARYPAHAVARQHREGLAGEARDVAPEAVPDQVDVGRLETS